MANPENVLGTTLANTFIGSTGQQVFDTKGRLYQGGRAIFSTDGAKASYMPEYFENILATSSNVLTPTTMTAYGVSCIMTTGVATSGVGLAGTGYGSGGSAGAAVNNGGAGTSGLVIVWEFY